ncbi:MAG: hypothetical protein WCS80_02225 [Bacilli bacterium]
MNIIEKDSAFSLDIDFTLSPTDEEVLSLLYLPIIKGDAFALYQCLFGFSGLIKEKIFFSHEDTESFLGYDDARLLKARSSLEAIGLLDTFRKESSCDQGGKKVEYAYRLIPPATPKKFFADVLLRGGLSCAVGGKKYFELKRHFSTRQEKSYDDYAKVSALFKDVFSLNIQADDPSMIDMENSTIEKNYKSLVSFDEKEFSSQLKALSISPKSIKKDYDEIVSLSILYALSEKEAAALVSKNINTEKNFFLIPFKEDARNFKKFRHEDSKVDEASLGNSKTSQQIKKYLSVTPQSFLFSLVNAAPASFMLNEIEKLKKDLGFSNGLINVILDYSLKQTNNEFNTLFIEKVAYSLSASKINDCYTAMVYLTDREYEKNQKLGRRKKTIRKTKDDDGDDTGSKEVGLDDIKKLSDDLGI